jgi:hypothetical protein
LCDGQQAILHGWLLFGRYQKHLLNEIFRV